MQSGSLYTTMAGLQAISAQMQAVASNLANQQTPGYAAVQAVTEAANYQGSNAPPGADALSLTPGPDITQGSINHTGDPMNVALSGDAWLQVQTSGGNALTRDGSLSLSSSGILTDSAGNPVLGATGQPISLPALASLKIGTDGTVSGVPAGTPGGPSQVYGKLGLFSTPPGTLTPLSGTLYSPPAGATLNASTNGSVQQGYLNGSNVDPTQSMMQMLDDSRSYQLQTNLMKAQSTAASALNQMLSQG
ncbi:MAG: flagellar biosynthesis protein FlgF [Acidocella sp. 20-63-7]|nr:MAG: flagellar biosynthesis protein FlgF [Acidocella sp. 20-63-7]HQT45964.1 flagellar hook-basal body complex protein [Acidocella sp.]